MLGLALVAMLAFSALSAGAASAAEAPRWKVKGAYLGAGTSKAFTATNTSQVLLKTAAVEFAASAGECTQTGEIEGSAVGSPGKKKNVVLSCKNVTVVGAKACAVKSPGAEAGVVTTNSLKSTLVWLKETGKAAGNLLEPTSGTSVATIAVSGCALAGEYPVINSVVDEFLPVEKESVTSELALPSPTILNYYDNNAPRVKQTITRLKMGGANATFTGKFAFSLNSKEAVGVSPPLIPTEPRWQVTAGGVSKPLFTGETISFTGASTGPLSISISGMTITAAGCTVTGKIVGSAVNQPGTEKEVVLTCKGAAVPGAPSCVVRSFGQPAGTFVTTKLKSRLVRLANQAAGAPVGEILEPESESYLFALEITECASLLNGPITGQLIAQLSAGEATTGTFSPGSWLTYWDYAASEAKCKEEKGEFDSDGLCKRTISRLKFGGSNVTFNGPFNYTLLGELTFGTLFG